MTARAANATSQELLGVPRVLLQLGCVITNLRLSVFYIPRSAWGNWFELHLFFKWESHLACVCVQVWMPSILPYNTKWLEYLYCAVSWILRPEKGWGFLLMLGTAKSNFHLTLFSFARVSESHPPKQLFLLKMHCRPQKNSGGDIFVVCYCVSNFWECAELKICITHVSQGVFCLSRHLTMTPVQAVGTLAASLKYLADSGDPLTLRLHSVCFLASKKTDSLFNWNFWFYGTSHSFCLVFIFTVFWD